MKIYWELLFVFIRIGIFTFGGGYAILPLMQKEVVDKKHWATEEEVMDYYTVTQCTPGIIMANAATSIGLYEKGVLGAIIATLGTATPSIIIVLLTTSVLTTYSSFVMVQYALADIRVTVCVLVSNTIVKLWKSGIRDVFDILLFVVVLSAVTFTSTSAVLIAIIAVLPSVIVYALRREEAKE